MAWTIHRHRLAIPTPQPGLSIRAEQTRPLAVAGHAGFVQLVDVKDNRVYLQMGGGCQGCGAADITLQAGIERMINEEIPAIEEVLDTTDHASGENPYHTPGK